MKEWLEYEQIVSSWGLCPLLCGVLGRTQSALLILKCQPWLNLPIHPVGLFVCFLIHTLGICDLKHIIVLLVLWAKRVSDSKYIRVHSEIPWYPSLHLEFSVCFLSTPTHNLKECLDHTLASPPFWLCPHLVLESGVRFSTVTSYRSSKCFRFWATSW